MIKKIIPLTYLLTYASLSMASDIIRIDKQSCPDDYVYVSLRDVEAESNKYCLLLNDWDIARINNKASLSGPGYGCKVIKHDTRHIGTSLCKLIDQEEPQPPKKDMLKVAYIEVNDNPIRDAGCFITENGKPLFDIAVIFAANINYDGEKAILHFNPQVNDLLENNIHQVRELQAKGIKVVLDVLGNHQNAGWSCFANVQQARAFAEVLKNAVDKYELDGIDIDDEYSKCNQEYENSLIKVTSALREIMPNKIISKALFHDQRYFETEWQHKKLHEQLSYGWEMSYWAASCNRVATYLNAGMSKEKLGIGVSTVITPPSTAKAISTCLKSQQLGGGMMVFNVNKHSESFLQSIWPDVKADQSCFNE